MEDKVCLVKQKSLQSFAEDFERASAFRKPYIITRKLMVSTIKILLPLKGKTQRKIHEIDKHRFINST